MSKKLYKKSSKKKNLKHQEKIIRNRVLRLRKEADELERKFQKTKKTSKNVKKRR